MLNYPTCSILCLVGLTDKLQLKRRIFYGLGRIHLKFSCHPEMTVLAEQCSAMGHYFRALVKVTKGTGLGRKKGTYW